MTRWTMYWLFTEQWKKHSLTYRSGKYDLWSWVNYKGPYCCFNHIQQLQCAEHLAVCYRSVCGVHVEKHVQTAQGYKHIQWAKPKIKHKLLLRYNKSKDERKLFSSFYLPASLDTDRTTPRLDSFTLLQTVSICRSDFIQSGPFSMQHSEAGQKLQLSRRV